MIARDQHGTSDSPSLSARRERGRRAYEVKFLVADDVATRIHDLASRSLFPDPHADSAGSYTTTTLYFDTPAGDVYLRSPGFRRRKFRVRRYGASRTVFLERKTKRDDRVRKVRCTVPIDDLNHLHHRAGDTDWPGHWFQRSLLFRSLAPACRVSYERMALFGDSETGPIRITFDRAIRGVSCPVFDLEPVGDVTPVLTGQVIVELKFSSAMPAAFKLMVQQFSLEPASVSKYRICRTIAESLAASGGANRA